MRQSSYANLTRFSLVATKLCITRALRVVALFATVACMYGFMQPRLQAQSFNVSDFRDTSGFTQVNLGTVGTSLNLTPLSPRPSAGAIWRTRKVDVSRAFTTTIQFVINDTGGTADPAGKGGADGFAFVMQLEGPERVGATGYNIGYGAIAGGLAVEVDTWDDSRELAWLQSNAVEDPADHVAIHSNGRGLLSAVPKFSLIHQSRVLGYAIDDGMPHTLAIVYRPGLLRVYVDDCSTALLSMNIWLDNVLLSDSAYIGLTAATQAAWQSHRVTSWCWSATGEGCGCTQPYCDTLYIASPPDTLWRDRIVRDTLVVDRWLIRHDTVTVREYIERADTVIVELLRIDSVRVNVYIHDTLTVVVKEVDSLVVIDTVYVQTDRWHTDTLKIETLRDTCALDTVIRIDSTVCAWQQRAFVWQDSVGIVARPNPASDGITFDISSPGAWSLDIYDPRGSLMFSRDGDGSGELYVPVAFAVGTYWARLTVGDRVRSIALRVER